MTEYEKFSDRYLGNRPVRDHVSPLRLLVQLGHHSVDMIQAKSALLCEPLSTWVFFKMQLNKWSVINQTLFTFVETSCFFLVTRPQWVITKAVTKMLSANHTNPNMNTSVNVCVSVPDHNLLPLTIMVCFALCQYFSIFMESLMAIHFSKYPRSLRFETSQILVMA